MLSLLQVAYALAVSPLIQQAGANPLPQIYAVSAPDSKGAVASESAICTNIGIDLLQQGGNAADAVSFDESEL
jgi:gamma-glutamyltranspeptidase / glutathione hydrolase